MNTNEAREDVSLEKKIEKNEKRGEAKNKKQAYGRLSFAALVGIVVITIMISSLFGAVFGFMSA